MSWFLDERDLLASGCVLRGVENHVLSVGDDTYRVVSCLCAEMGNIHRVSSSHVLTRRGCDLSWRTVLGLLHPTEDGTAVFRNVTLDQATILKRSVFLGEPL